MKKFDPSFSDVSLMCVCWVPTIELLFSLFPSALNCIQLCTWTWFIRPWVISDRWLVITNQLAPHNSVKYVLCCASNLTLYSDAVTNYRYISKSINETKREKKNRAETHSAPLHINKQKSILPQSLQINDWLNCVVLFSLIHFTTHYTHTGIDIMIRIIDEQIFSFHYTRRCTNCSVRNKRWRWKEKSFFSGFDVSPCRPTIGRSVCKADRL